MRVRGWEAGRWQVVWRWRSREPTGDKLMGLFKNTTGILCLESRYILLHFTYKKKQLKLVYK
jgi:hypothetical protein